MRKIFTLLTLCLLASAAWAAEVTFIPANDQGTGSTTAGAFYIEKDGVRIDVENGLVNDTQYRFYKNKNVTISSTAGDILKVVFECTAEGTNQYGPGCFTAAPGNYSYEGKIGTWEGQANSVVFTAATNQVRATKITVTVGEAGLAAPSITPAAGTYYSPIEVTISCWTNGAQIYYTTNGSDPTTNSTLYSAPFTLSSNATVKAISAKDGETSDVVSATYEFATATPVANIAAYQVIADGTVVMFNNPVNVLAQSANKRYLYVKDNSGYALIYSDCGQTYVNGDVIPAGFVGTKKTYNGEPELADPLSGFQPASGNSPIAPTTPFTANQVGHATFANYVSMDEVTFTKDGNNYTLTDASGNTCAVYFGTMGVNAPSDLNAKYDVIGIVGSYGNENTVYQLLPTFCKKHTNPGEGFGWGDMGDTPDNTEVTFEVESTVIWQSGLYLYAMDQTGFGLAYGNVGQTYNHGDKIPAGFGGKKTTYKGEPELAAVQSGQPLPGFQAASGNERPTPEEITVNEVNHDHWAHYVVLKNAMINAEATIITQNGATCEMYNKTFNATLPEDLSVPHTIYGVVAVFNNYQILPISFDYPPGEAPVPEPEDVANINELYALSTGAQGHFTTPLTTIYQHGPNLYVKDVDGNYSLVYGTVAYTEFVNGDFINDAVASWTTYQNNKQMVPKAETFVKAGHGTAVEPEVMPIEEVSQDMVHWFLGFEDVAIVTEEDKTYVQDETGRIQLFDKFGVITEGLDLSAVNYVEGFLTIYKGELELYPITLGGGEVPCGMKGDVNNDGEINIADINALIDIILSGNTVDACTFWRADIAEDGELGIADVNAIIDRILSL
ncbi:MAG: chitobiase/beta-hexosaminidase C-terminal domain-containing protein [Muribaculaceae bacterium]|nr:chitobiase/beta-hexosaminidase C-terminal domain-containing protein [Muribaculaceae bacterium]